MKTSSPPPSAEMVEFLDAEQAEVAKEARTVKDFKEGFHKRTEELVKHGRLDKGLVEKRGTLIDDAAKGNENLRLDELEENQLGEATIDGGESKILLAKSVAAAIRTEADVEQMLHAAAHERDHAKTKVLKGELYFEDEEPVDHELILEGKAEITANLKRGKNKLERREGQPKELYGEGQDLMLRLERSVKGGREKIWHVLETTGDLSEIQAALEA